MSVNEDEVGGKSEGDHHQGEEKAYTERTRRKRHFLMVGAAMMAALVGPYATSFFGDLFEGELTPYTYKAFTFGYYESWSLVHWPSVFWHWFLGSGITSTKFWFLG